MVMEKLSTLNIKDWWEYFIHIGKIKKIQKSKPITETGRIRKKWCGFTSPCFYGQGAPACPDYLKKYIEHEVIVNTTDGWGSRSNWDIEKINNMSNADKLEMLLLIVKYFSGSRYDYENKEVAKLPIKVLSKIAIEHIQVKHDRISKIKEFDKFKIPDVSKANELKYRWVED